MNTNLESVGYAVPALKSALCSIPQQWTAQAHLLTSSSTRLRDMSKTRWRRDHFRNFHRPRHLLSWTTRKQVRGFSHLNHLHCTLCMFSFVIFSLYFCFSVGLMFELNFYVSSVVERTQCNVAASCFFLYLPWIEPYLSHLLASSFCCAWGRVLFLLHRSPASTPPHLRYAPQLLITANQNLRELSACNQVLCWTHGTWIMKETLHPQGDLQTYCETDNVIIP